MRDFSFLKDYAFWQDWSKSKNELVGRVYFVFWVIRHKENPKINGFAFPVNIRDSSSEEQKKEAKKKALEDAWKELSKDIKKGKVPVGDKSIEFMSLAPATKIPEDYKKYIHWFKS